MFEAKKQEENNVEQSMESPKPSLLPSQRVKFETADRDDEFTDLDPSGEGGQ